MSQYSLIKTCKKCKFKEYSMHIVYGDFDGWSDEDRILTNCPVCRAVKRSKKSLLKEIENLQSKLSELHGDYEILLNHCFELESQIKKYEN